MEIRIGQGVDVHAFEAGGRLILGGIDVPHHSGLKAHSDGDALLHAITDAICGAMGRGDIGEFFPDTDSRWKGADSAQLLSRVVEVMKKEQWKILNIDSTVVTEQPKIGPYRQQIKERIAQILELPADAVGVKATTCEQMGFLGRGEGLMATAVVLISRFSS
ncbi:2-C-methyl-D-erythritol 2,4-cyclodiphosphate synthase [bacterium]|jgi:2-C-methyl-D-erythritol 2,4-cyclodiphosphate synthase|nr:2-C-methyl-D-erythritol 2,4-cyclodiphosphate synthase [bacterium]